MTHLSTASLLGSILTAALTTVQAASESPVAADQPGQAPTSIGQGIVYVPPLRGAPATRVGGASRSNTADGRVLSVLAPEQTGLTVNSQPVLYWYVSKPVTVPVEFTLNDPQASRPLLETRLKGPFNPGIRSLPLSGYSLKPGIEYQWSITLVFDEAQRSKDVIAGGTIRLVQPSSRLEADLRGADPRKAPVIYAAQGIWYDALASLSQLIEANPADKVLREQRAALLEQVGLNAAADEIRATRR